MTEAKLVDIFTAIEAYHDAEVSRVNSLAEFEERLAKAVEQKAAHKWPQAVVHKLLVETHELLQAQARERALGLEAIQRLVESAGMEETQKMDLDDIASVGRMTIGRLKP